MKTNVKDLYRFDFRNPEGRRERLLELKQLGSKNQFFDPEHEIEVVKKMNNCQQNWDHSREIGSEIIDYFLWIAQNSPSKQHEAYFDVYWTADLGVIKELYDHSWGKVHSVDPPSMWRSPQVNARLYILFVAKEPETQLNCHSDGRLKSNSDPARWENSYTSIGIAMGLVMRAANSLGFATGSNANHSDLNGECFWEKRLGILDDVKAGRKKVTFGIGIGRPADRSAFEFDQEEICLGSTDGRHIAEPESKDSIPAKHPITGEELQEVKFAKIHESEDVV
ncbi:MAG: hypothetical protein AAF202_14210, partial [Pseudomonadota bacterium]